MSLIAKTSYFWRSAVQGMGRAPFIHFVAVVTLTIALFAVGLTRAGARFVDQLILSLDDQVQMTVYLKTEATDADVTQVAQAVAERFRAQPTVVSPKEALARLSTELGDGADVLKDLTDNPLPTTLEVRLPKARRSLAGLREAVAEVRALPTVSAVDYGEDALERLSAIAHVLTLAGAFGLGVVFLATIIIVSATLQLAIYARREEVEIQKLVGATNRFVKAPFLIEGFLQGLAGAVLAVLLLWAFFTFARPHLEGVFGFLRLPRSNGSPLTLLGVGELLALGAGLGLGGSFIAVGRFLKV